MNWNDFQQVLRVRAVEESDAAARAWDAGDIRNATLGVADADDAERLSGRAKTMLAGIRDKTLLKGLDVPVIPGWAVTGATLLALVTGWWFAALGQEREINLLSLPLIAILLWNAVVLLLSLFHGAGASAHGMPAALVRFLADKGADEKGEQHARDRFHALAGPVFLQRLGFRFRAWLHLAAALLAFGGISGMYARGWSKEYRAVWESTLLNERGARTFLGALFAPAAKLSGMEIPLDELPQMRRRAESPAEKPGVALPWIHLYALTLVLTVIAPRLLFVLLELHRAGRVPDLQLRSPDWQDYAEGIRSAVAGDGVTVEVIAHGLVSDDAARERWRRVVRMRWRDGGGISWKTVAPGAETEFVSSWSPAAMRVLLVFNLSATPETEVHRAFVQEIVSRLRGMKSSATLLVTLDDVELKKRWSAFADADARLQARDDSWRETLRGSGAEWI